MNKKQSFLTGLRAYFGGGSDTVRPAPAQRLRLSGRAIRIPFEGLPFAVDMGRQRLHIYPDFVLDERYQKVPYDCILFDPERYAAGISHFLRLTPGQKLLIDSRSADQQYLFSHPREARRRHFQVSHEGGALVFKDPISEADTYVSLLQDEAEVARVTTRRRHALKRVVEIFGGSLEQLPQEEALATVRQVNRLLKQEAYRQKDAYGHAGGVVALPAHLTPILVGDLHGQVDNLLKILSENAFMESLERNEAALIFLGDAIHPEAEDALENMESSVLMMDLVFKLKLRFPTQVFFLIGNHDSFSLEAMKNGVSQGLHWDKHLTALRGEAYREAMALFYQLSPLVAVSDDFVACHAGPTRARITRQMLVNVRRYPDLVLELTWNRVLSPGTPSGYTRADVRRFRKALDLDKHVPFIVGHHPLSTDRTVWLNVCNIAQHHIVFSAMDDQIGLFTRIDGEMVPQVYPTEPLTAWVNEQVSEKGV